MRVTRSEAGEMYAEEQYYSGSQAGHSVFSGEPRALSDLELTIQQATGYSTSCHSKILQYTR